MTRVRAYARGTDDFRQAEHPSDPREWGADCDHCPLNGATPVWGDGPRDPLIAFIGEAPGREEVKMGVPFIGKSGELLESYLKKQGFSRQEVWVTNALLCFPPGGDLKAYLQVVKKKAKKEGVELRNPVDCCRNRLMHELKVPLCFTCGRRIRGPLGYACACKKSMPIKRGDGHMPEVTQPLGNFAMEATMGVSGISARRGYVEDMDKRRRGERQ